jgi:MATE family multidrug resistance protein
MLASFSFMIPVGISSAAAVRVGYAVGRGDATAGRRAAQVAVVGGAAVMAFFCVLFLAWPEPLVRLFTASPAVLPIAVVLIPIAGLFQVFDGIQVVCIGILRGLGDTRAPLVVNLIGFWLLGIPIGLWLAFSQGLGPAGLWWGLVIALVVVAIILLARSVWQLGRPIERIRIDDRAPSSQPRQTA